MVQYLASKSGWDPEKSPIPGAPCGADSKCETMLGGSVVSVNGLIQLNGGLNALLQAILLTTVGSLADYGNNGPHILLVITLVSCAAQISFLAFGDDASRYWGVPLLVGLIFQVSYGASLVFLWATFPQLAVNDPKVREARRNQVNVEDYLVVESMQRNHISTLSTAWSNIGFFAICLVVVVVAVILARYYDTAFEDIPPYSNSVYSAVCGIYWLVFAIPWFILHKKRPGPPLPPNTNYFTYGWIKVGRALREYKRLPHTFLYLLGYFLLSDAVASTNQVTQVLTNILTNYDGLVQTYLNLVNSACSILGCLIFLYFQKRFYLSTRTMLQISTGLTLAIPVWGCIGLLSQTVGFRTLTELWIYNAWFGLFTAPFYAYSQTMMSELTPTGSEHLFFALFGIASKLAQFAGPAVTGGITEATKDDRSGFIPCAIFQLLPIIIFAYIDVSRAEVRLRIYEEQERRNSEQSPYSVSSISLPKQSTSY